MIETYLNTIPMQSVEQVTGDVKNYWTVSHGKKDACQEEVIRQKKNQIKTKKIN